MTLYTLKQYPDNLARVISELDPELANITDVTDVNHILKCSGWLLSLDEDRIPAHALTHIQLMITGYGSVVDLNRKDPAVALGLDINQMYPDVINIWPILTTVEIKMPKHGDVPVNSAIDETVPDKT